MRSLLLLLVAVVVLSPVEPFLASRGKQHKNHSEMDPREEPCHFPFRYQREMHYSCILSNFPGPQPWCATTENFDRDQQWRFCESEERPRETMKLPGHCDPNPCQNGANCEARRSGFHCICNPGFYGKHCEKESCFESPGRLHIGEKETWLRHQPTGLEECHCAGKKKIVCKPVHGKECARNPCLNGGHCIVLRQGWVCSCPGRFSGPLCDIDHTHTCYNGNGHLYRGMAQSTFSGEPCLPWDSPILFHEFSSNTLKNAVSLGLGAHAFCRNPDNDSQPWCYVLQGKQLSWGFCSVTPCHPHPNNSETVMHEGQPVEPVTESPARANGIQSGAGSAAECGQRYTKTSSLRSRVVGGIVALADAHPYMAAIYVAEQFCGGSLIASCWILTAAHCLERRPDVSQISVVLGQTLYNITTKSARTFQVQGYQLHEDYSEINKHHDIALVQLKGNVTGHCAEFSHSISPVCLPSSTEIYEGNRCQTAGWGHLYEGADKLSVYLQEADVPIIPHEQCQSHEVHGTRVTSKMLCAGFLDGRSDTCQGDSGGPLVCDEQNRAVLRGIVSWGTGCARVNKPGVYTNVAHYLDWIQSKMH